MKFFPLYIFIVIIAISCKESDKATLGTNFIAKDVNDQDYVKDEKFKKGDIRRYGIYPEAYFSEKDWKAVVELADKGLPITFVEGTYSGNLIFKGVDSVNIRFNDVTITGALQIIDNDGLASQNILLLGQVTFLDKVFIRKSKHIQFNELNIISDTVSSIFRKKNRGLSIYMGSKNIKIDTLRIRDTGGSNDELYKLSAAAMQIHGYNNNPEDIKIKYLKIENAARTALYLTGNNHEIGRVEIDNFGYGSNENMFGLEDTQPGAQTVFSGAWFNKCNDCTIDTLYIKASQYNKTYSANFGLGTYSKPCIINNIRFNKFAEKMPIKDDVLTNVLVKNILEND